MIEVDDGDMRRYPAFITMTCLWWRPVLVEDRFKDIVVKSLAFLSREKRVVVYAFVIMNNHMHLVWRILGAHRREDVQRDFLGFTSKQILRILKDENSPMYRRLLVNAADRVYQVWERNSLSKSVWSPAVKWQKINYIHRNPVKAGLCRYAEEYKYSSASFYYSGDRRWEFLVHINERKRDAQ